MRPIPVGASAAMLFSLLVAFIVTPWAANRLLFFRRAREKSDSDQTRESLLTRAYRWVMGPLLAHRGWRWTFRGTIAVLLIGSMTLVGIGWVQVKVLPFGNNNDFQVILVLAEWRSL